MRPALCAESRGLLHDDDRVSVAEWLPEPNVVDGYDDPARHAETADLLSLAILIGQSAEAVRQRPTRARHHVE